MSKPKHDYVVTATDKNPAREESRKMFKAVVIILVFAVICSINF